MKKTMMMLAATALIGTGAHAQDKTQMDHSKMDHAKMDHNAKMLSMVLADPRRADDMARDQYRHPAETLAFFGVTPEMTVAEYAPAGGWYSKILAPYVAEKGKFIGLQFAPDPLPFGDDAKERIRGFGTKFPGEVAEWTGMPAATFAAYTSDTIPDDVKGTADIVIIPRMMHNLMRWNVADNEIKSIRSLLKDGGMVGIIQHRAKDGAPFSYADGNKGYLRTDTVVNFMEAHGFELVGSSEVNANPNDTADYPDGVWTLPPAYALKDTDKAKYEAIGESDRMTLLFKKLP